MFSIDHLLWLALVAAGISSLLIFSIKCRFSFRIVSGFMLGISGISEFLKILTNIAENQNGEGFVISQDALPLHLCSIMIFIYFALPFLKEGALKERLKSFVTVTGLLGALFALLIPINGTDFSKLQSYQYFIYHSAMIFFSLYLMVTGQVNLKFRAYINNMLTIFLLSIIMIWVNSLLNVYNTNFFFIVRPPMSNLPVLNLNNGWHRYYFSIVGIGLFAITLVHLPSLFKKDE